MVSPIRHLPWLVLVLLAFAPCLGDVSADEPALEACRRLESLCYQHTKQREFPAAMAAAHELAQRRTALFGPEHWQTVDARLNVALVERLAQLTDDQWRQFILADQLHAEAARLQRACKNADALPKAEQALPIYTSLLGRDRGPTLSCLSNLLVCHLELGQYFKALPYVKEIIELEPRAKGTLHPDTVLSLKLLARFNEAVGDLANAEEVLRKVVEIQTAMLGPDHPDTVSARVDLAKVCSDQDKFAEATPMLVEALEQQRRDLGDEHLATAQTMKVLGAAYTRQGNFAAAEPLLANCVAVFRKLAGDKHLATASAYNARGKLYVDTGRFGQADRALKDSLAICLDTYGDHHPVTAKVLDNLARLNESGSNTGLARQIRLQCLRIAEASYGEMNVLTADALENVARTYILMNDLGLAETYLLRAREIRRKLLGEEHPQTAAIVGQLAYVYLGVGETGRAEPLFHEALAVLEKAFGAESAQTGRIRKRLALLYQSQGRFEQAETHYRQALRSFQRQVGADHPATAEVKVGLAQTVLSRGKAAEAVRLIDEGLHAYQRTLHPNDPQWIDALGIAGTAYLASGDAAAAERRLSRGLAIAQARMQQSGAFESERQRLAQMMMLRTMFDLYLSLPANLATSADSLYPHVLSWKGAVASRQWRDRQTVNEETAPLDAELQQITRQLATLTLNVPEVDGRQTWIGRIFELNMRKEALEQQRAVYSSRVQGDPEASMADVQRVLPSATALVDILQYSHTSFDDVNGVLEMARRERCVAFVLRRDRPVQRIDLGDAAPIAEAVIKWRQTRGFRPNQGKQDWAVAVGELVWPPLGPHVDDCKTLLISPDGSLARFAWNVLPGREPDRYLIEEFAIGMIPVPQLLPAMLNLRSEPSRDSLLLVGDVDYNAPAAKASETGPRPQGQGGRPRFSPLEGTSAEVRALGDHFQRRFPGGEVVLLDKAGATEEAFWQHAPRHCWLHLATHGFFAPPSVKAAIATQHRMDPAATERPGVSVFHVGYLNGLALSGANVGPVSDGDDGILTAAELATMDLRKVDVAVLSGCETGLGEVQSGEGSFGMQRALQIAGVGTTIGSLWTVSDEKTNLLMQRFYVNLWDKKLSKLDALREAQLWMLNSDGKRLSPHYWAAFVLSGDWR